MPRWVDAGPADVPDGEVRNLVLEGHGLVLARCEGALKALEDRCSHDDGPLGEGVLAGCEVVCPRHGARFDLRDGRATRMPAISPIHSFPVEERDGRVMVDLEGV